MSDHDPTYAAKLISLLRKSPEPAKTFIDAGACRGDFTGFLIGAFPHASVHALEPDPALCEVVSHRFREMANVRAWQVALNESRGFAKLHVHEDPGTSSLLARPAHGRRYYHRRDRVLATIDVPTLSLDEFIAERGASSIALLKLDTQGSELSILRGARNALERGTIDAIYTEFFVVHHYDGAPLLGDQIAVLNTFGYSLFDLFKGPYASNGQLRFGDAIFVSPQFRARYLDASSDES
ncbi:MAG TPA: FkbM family methyltransferase [Casimicrobiaceae bacterium]|nr:FkbM family methyltransferase [Casimicrobiaceae bacterium]